MPITGKSAIAQYKDNGIITAIPMQVTASVKITVRMMPSLEAKKPQINLPVAPPAKVKAKAIPTVSTAAPFEINKKGGNYYFWWYNSETNFLKRFYKIFHSNASKKKLEWL